MKNIKVLICTSPLVIAFILLNTSLSYSQSWKWGREGYGSLKSNDHGSPVATDKAGNAYVTGQYANIIVFGNIILTGGSENAYLTKYNSAGNVVWATQANDSANGFSFGTSVATDVKGNVFIGGMFIGTVTFGNYTLRANNNNYGYSTYLVKYDSAGNALWAEQSEIISSSLYYNAQVACNSVATDQSGNSFITGYFEDTISFGSYTLKTVQAYSSFLVKYNPSGNVLWAEQSTTNTDYTLKNYNNIIPTSVATDNLGNSFITGSFSDTVFFANDTLINPLYGNYSNSAAFLVKYSPSGNVLWATQAYNGSVASQSTGNSVTTDQYGSAYITGSFENLVSFETYSVYSAATNSTYLTKYNSNGTVDWVKQSSPGWEGFTLSSDAANDIYLSGGSYSINTDTLAFGNFKLSTNPNAYFASYLVEFNSKGEATCGSILNYDGGYLYGLQTTGIASNTLGSYIYTAGTLSNDSIICGPDTLAPKGGGADVYLARWVPCSIPNITPPPTQQGGGSEACDNIFIPDAFSPNGDGHNDVLYVRSPCISSMDFLVFDRWGNKVFETGDINNGWDGTYNGKPANMGTYIWYLTATTIDGASIEKNGNVTLVR